VHGSRRKRGESAGTLLHLFETGVSVPGWASDWSRRRRRCHAHSIPSRSDRPSSLRICRISETRLAALTSFTVVANSTPRWRSVPDRSFGRTFVPSRFQTSGACRLSCPSGARRAYHVGYTAGHLPAPLAGERGPLDSAGSNHEMAVSGDELLSIATLRRAASTVL
jgi:hypothetical protein